MCRKLWPNNNINKLKDSKDELIVRHEDTLINFAVKNCLLYNMHISRAIFFRFEVHTPGFSFRRRPHGLSQYFGHDCAHPDHFLHEGTEQNCIIYEEHTVSGSKCLLNVIPTDCLRTRLEGNEKSTAGLFDVKQKVVI